MRRGDKSSTDTRVKICPSYVVISTSLLPVPWASSSVLADKSCCRGNNILRRLAVRMFVLLFLCLFRMSSVCWLSRQQISAKDIHSSLSNSDGSSHPPVFLFPTAKFTYFVASPRNCREGSSFRRVVVDRYSNPGPSIKQERSHVMVPPT